MIHRRIWAGIRGTMTPAEYIRAGVELAPGWGYNSKQNYIWTPTQGHYSDLPPEMIDALAAALKREADTVEKCRYEVFENAADSAIKEGAGVSIIHQVWGKCRSMNTIMAVVDSGILK